MKKKRTIPVKNYPKKTMVPTTSPINNHPVRWAAVVLVMIGLFVFGRNKDRNANALSTAAPIQVPIQNDRWDEMVATLAPIVDNYEGDVGLYIKDLKTGHTFERNADKPFVSASLIKIPIMVAVCQAIHDGFLSLDTRIKLRSSSRRGGSGELKWVHSGRTFRVSDLLYQMITKSDNTATAMMIDKLGYGYLNNSFNKFGLEVTQINPRGMSLASYIHPSDDNYTTPREMGNLLEKLYKHELVDDALSDMMLEIMKGAKGRSRLAAYLPGDWKFARKTGLLRRYCHDVGIVFSPNSDYVICVLTGHNNNYRKAKGFIASVGRKAYEFMGSS
jgi:beta-lactamase class A